MRTLMDPNVFPPALRGIMLAAFCAAYMSTIGTQLNWGASYVVNDFYRRFVRRRGAEREYVIVSQAVTVGLMLAVDLRDAAPGVDRAGVEAADRDRRRHRHRAAAAVVLVAHQRLVRGLGDGGGRSGVAVSAARVEMGQRSAARLRLHHDRHGDVDDDRMAGGHLDDGAGAGRRRCRRFYRRVRPHGRGWAPIAAAVGLPAASGSLGGELLNALLGCVLVYAALFGVGEILLGSAARGAILLVIAVLAAGAIARNLEAEERRDSATRDAATS